MLKMLSYTGARVSEFVQFRVEDLHLALNPPQVYIAKAKGDSDGYVPLLPAVAQELRTYLPNDCVASTGASTGVWSMLRAFTLPECPSLSLRHHLANLKKSADIIH